MPLRCVFCGKCAPCKEQFGGQCHPQYSCTGKGGSHIRNIADFRKSEVHFAALICDSEVTRQRNAQPGAGGGALHPGYSGLGTGADIPGCLPHLTDACCNGNFQSLRMVNAVFHGLDVTAGRKTPIVPLKDQNTDFVVLCAVICAV